MNKKDVFFVFFFSRNWKSQFVEFSRASLEKEEASLEHKLLNYLCRLQCNTAAARTRPSIGKPFDAVHLPSLPASPCCSAPYEKYATTAEEMKNKLQRMRVSHVISGL